MHLNPDPTFVIQHKFIICFLFCVDLLGFGVFPLSRNYA